MAKKAFSKADYLYWFELMLLMRRFEERAGQLYGTKIRGFCHLYIGQEAVVAGMMSAMGPNDKVITAYRDHGHALGMGISPGAVMAELYGKITGCTKGKGGSMHLFDKEKRFLGGHGIVGAQIPLGAGIAFAEKYQGTDNVCLCFMGDGAVRQGALHETFNIAMTWKLPVVFIIENNMYAMGTSVARTSNVTDLHRLGQAYDMPNQAVDGMKVESVHQAIADACNRARTEQIPTLLEIKTYRYKGHSMSDPAKYRTREEVEEYRRIDPIEQVRATILDKGYANQATLDDIETKVLAQVDESVQFAEDSPYPPDSELYTDVYMQADYPYLQD
ncbi:MAG: pyruvate dehydrogenase (acetyl-transferring) E1 component subunit alpha [Bacteroidetes bacterium]|jgi:pyruvate dehydrogenase E1 component alpha subunit|nr:pyruvate dehydrogenase (acetyl-transferring) E1 component subunit alpha [Bacteroidota bacterium]